MPPFLFFMHPMGVLMLLALRAPTRRAKQNNSPSDCEADFADAVRAHA